MTVKWNVPPDEDDTSPYLGEVAFLRHECKECGFEHVLCVSLIRRVFDVPFGDHPVIFEFTEGHTRCPKTGQETEYKSRDKQCTARLIRYLQRHHGHEPHRALAQRVGVTPSQVLKYQKQVEVREPQREVVNLGLDDLYLFKQRFVVATDLDTGKLLLLEPGAPMIQGKADQMNFDQVLKQLPTPTNVAVDMHREQLAAVERTWPDATVVIDKRHLLQTIDRDLLELVGNVVLVWRSQTSDSFSVPQALRTFGAAAYPYLALRTLVLRRQALLTPADHAAWLLLRREGGEAQRLWEAYQWREALYDIYDERLTGTYFVEELETTRFEAELERWKREAQAWQYAVIGSKKEEQKRKAQALQKARAGTNGNDRNGEKGEDNQSSRSFRAPLGRILWALKVYSKQCSAYSRARLTNARTELVNAKIRRYVRRGHRYSPQTLLALINRDLEQSGLVRAAALPPSKDQGVLAAQDAQVESLEMSTEGATSTEPLPERQAKRTISSRGGRTSRHRPVPHDSIDLPEHVWEWLHSVTTPGGRQGKRWYHVVLSTAPPTDRWAWELLCRGQRSGNEDDLSGGDRSTELTDIQLVRWRLSLMHVYFQEQSRTLSPAGYEPLVRLKGLNIYRLVAEEPALAIKLDRVWRRLAATSYGSLIKPHQDVLRDVERWHRKKPVVPGSAGAHVSP